MEIKAIQGFCDSIDGFLSQNGENLFEGEVLYHLARSLPSHSVVVEIGSWQGKSTIWLGKGIEAGHSDHMTLYAIDPHVGSVEHQGSSKKVWTFPNFEKNIKKASLESIVTPLTMTSVEGVKKVDKKVDLIFIDGAHDYDSVKVDLATWFPKVKEGGVIAFHDSFRGWPGVERLVRERVYFSNCFKKIRYINSITYAIKAEKITFFERLENYHTYWIRQVHLLSLRLPQPFRSLLKRFVWRPFQRKWLRELSTRPAD